MKKITTPQPGLLNKLVKSWLFMIAVVVLHACTEDVAPPPFGGSGDITTIAGIAGQFDNAGDGGLATSAKIGWVNDITTDANDNIYFADGAANVIRRIDATTGNITTVAGTFLGFNVVDPTPAAGDGGLATAAHLNVPMGVATDAAGNVYIADTGNHSIRKINVSTGIITTVAGTGVPGYSGDGSAATSAEIYSPYDLALDSNGNIYFTDSGNELVRKVTASTGFITTYAGAYGPSGYTGDGAPATAAQMHAPQGIAVDANDNVYIVDAGNHAVRKVTAATGIITSIAGTGTYGFSGDNGSAPAAQLYAPSRVAVDENGDVYIADQGNQVIRKIVKTTNIIITYAGTPGQAGYSGDGGAAVSARLSAPQGVTVDSTGRILITETGNSVVRAVTP